MPSWRLDLLATAQRPALASASSQRLAWLSLKAEAEWYLEQSVAKFAAGVEAVITAPVDENEFAALVSLAYNIGNDRLP